MGGGKIIEMILVVIVGVLWVSTVIQITPSLAQQKEYCWTTIGDCLTKNLNDTSNPKFNVSSTSFNKTEFLCCPLLQHTARNDKQCFCDVNDYVHRNPSNNTSGTLSTLHDCNITSSDTLASLDAFCSGNHSLAPRLSPTPGPPPPIPPPSTTPTSDSPPSHVFGKKKIITTVAASSAALLVLVALGIILYRIRLNKKASVAKSKTVPPGDLHRSPAALDNIITPESLQYEFGALKTATGDFSNDHKIGQGGFGAVYKGILPNGQVVAVKRLSRGSWQGDIEFKNEATLMAKLRHRNLVRLVGFCLESEERLLVYEFMPNKSLDHLLFDPELQKQLNWSKRYNIIKGIARGMLYLHVDSPTRIIHRDMKVSNVLLDAEMNPKIADFGMAKIFHVEQTQSSTSRIIGTHGYMAPEYLLHGQFSIKSDVYSFGVIVLEIVSGRKVTSSMSQFGAPVENLLSYAWICFRDGRALDFMDPTLRDSDSQNEIIRCIHMGLLCVQEDTRNRPTMEKVVLMFNSDSDVTDLVLPQHPGILYGRYSEQSVTTETTSVQWSANDASISELTAR